MCSRLRGTGLETLIQCILLLWPIAYYSENSANMKRNRGTRIPDGNLKLIKVLRGVINFNVCETA